MRKMHLFGVYFGHSYLHYECSPFQKNGRSKKTTRSATEPGVKKVDEMVYTVTPGSTSLHNEKSKKILYKKLCWV